MCSDRIPAPAICESLPYRATKILKLKPYVYEVINGKRKRVSPLVVENGIITEIKERAVIGLYDL